MAVATSRSASDAPGARVLRRAAETSPGTWQCRATRSALVRSAMRRAASRCAGIGPGGVQDDGLAGGQQGGCAVEQGRVGLGGPLGCVQALAVAGGRGLLGGDAGQFLAEAVAAEQRDAQAVGQRAGEGGLPAARQPADERQADGGGAQVAQRRRDQSP